MSITETVCCSRKCSARFQAAKANDKDKFVHEKRMNLSEKAGDKYHGHLSLHTYIPPQKHSGAISGNGDDKLPSPAS